MPHKPDKPRKHHDRHRHDERISAFLDHDRIDQILMKLVPDDDDRGFVVRCLLDEGPPHHRGSNFILLCLLAGLLEGHVEPSDDAELAQVPMRVPPHLAEDRSDIAFPIAIPRAALERLSPGDRRAQQAMIDCLIDGPPQHALANAVMLCLIDAALRQRDRGAAATEPSKPPTGAE